MRPSPLSVALALAGLLSACSGDAAPARAPVVYGEDGRMEVYEHPSAIHRALAETAIAVKIHGRWIDESDPSDVRITYTRTLGEAKNLCAGQRFLDQIEPGTCSGTLIDDRHILTAGHCMDSADDCAEYAWVLGFHYAAAGVLAPIEAADVYRCASVIAYHDDGEVDHAFVRLDRPVTGHAPAPVQPPTTAFARGTPLVLIGHPNGIPMKIDSGGIVAWSSSDLRWLTATLDAFNGNSGSGVFDAEGHMVAILRGGETDYVASGGCYIVNVIDPPPATDAEQLTYVGRALDAFCASGVPSTLCGCEPPCAEVLPGDRCADAEPIEPISQTIEGTLAGYIGLTSASCGGDGPERSYAFTLERRTRVVARSRGYDSVLYLRASCEGADLACHDDVNRDTDRGSLIELVLEPGSYVLVLDAFGGRVGPFTLDLTFEPEPIADDASIPRRDASIPRRDAGPSPSDAGPPSPPPGCGCAVHARSGGLASAAILIGLVLIAARAGRRRR